MKTLTSTLEAAQKADSRDPYLKVVVGAYTFGTDRIIRLVHEQQPFTDKATITLDNSDDYFQLKDLQGATVTIGLGFVTGAGNEYIDKPRMKVMSQLHHSSEGKLICELECVGILNEIGEDRADVRFEASDETLQTLVSGILESTLAPYNQCENFTVQYDTVGDLIGTVVPGSSFRINTNGSRLAAVKRLLDITWCVMRPENDGEIHIFKPVTLGVDFDYVYELGEHDFFTKSQSNTIIIPNYVTVRTDEDAEPYYEGHASHLGSMIAYKAVGYHMVVNGLTSDQEGTDIAESILSKFAMHSVNAGAEVPVNVGAEIFDYVKIYDSRSGLNVTGNVGYIRTVYGEDERGNKEFNMTFGLGRWLTIRQPYNEVGGLPGEGEQSYFQELVVDTLYLSPINLDYIEDGITYQRVKSAALSAEGLVLLDEVQDTGGTYSKVRATQVIAGEVLISSETQFDLGYNPITKEEYVTRSPAAPSPPTINEIWVDTGPTPHIWKMWNGHEWVKCSPQTLDEVYDGTTYSRTSSAALTAEGLVLLDQVSIGDSYDLIAKADLTAHHLRLDTVVQDGTYGLVYSADLTSNKLNLSSTQQSAEASYVKGTEVESGIIKLYSGTIKDGEWYNQGDIIIDANLGIWGAHAGQTQFYISAIDGKAYFAAGQIQCDNQGLHIDGEYLRCYSSGVYIGGFGSSTTSHINVQSATGKGLWLQAMGAEVYIMSTASTPSILTKGHIRTDANATYDIGQGNPRFKDGWFSGTLYSSYVNAAIGVFNDVNAGGDVTLSDLAGSGTRAIGVDSSGKIVLMP